MGGAEGGSNAVAVQDLGELTGERELQVAASPCSPGLGDPSRRVSPPALPCPVGYRTESSAEAKSRAAGGVTVFPGAGSSERGSATPHLQLPGAGQWGRAFLQTLG